MHSSNSASYFLFLTALKISTAKVRAVVFCLFWGFFWPVAHRQAAKAAAAGPAGTSGAGYPQELGTLRSQNLNLPHSQPDLSCWFLTCFTIRVQGMRMEKLVYKRVFGNNKTWQWDTGMARLGKDQLGSESAPFW